MTATIETTTTTLDNKVQVTETTMRNFEISTYCHCAYCNDCGIVMVVEYGDPCVECDTDEHMDYYMDYCTDACTYDREVVEEYLKKWKSKHRNKYVLSIAQGNHPFFGTPRIGYRVMRMDRNFVDALSLDTDWTQRWNIDTKRGGEVSCNRSHHDQPMGEYITFRPMTTRERAHLDSHGYIVLNEDHEMVKPCDYCEDREGKCVGLGGDGCGNMVIWL